VLECKQTGLYDSLLKRWGYIYATSGVIGLMREWISGGFPLENRAFAELILRMSFRANSAK
jgi:hypothetical protein